MSNVATIDVVTALVGLHGEDELTDSKVHPTFSPRTGQRVSHQEDLGFAAALGVVLALLFCGVRKVSARVRSMYILHIRGKGDTVLYSLCLVSFTLAALLLLSSFIS
jgi:hypothetical protein